MASSAPSAPLPRLRQAVIAARDLDATTAKLRNAFDLGEPYADPAVEYFGLRNAVFALDGTFLEVVSPLHDDAPAARLLRRRGGDCGYMLMFQVDDVAQARRRAREASVRQVFEVDLEDMTEVHLHPADIGGAIVALSEPRPVESWRWGGPDWEQRESQARVLGAVLAIPDATSVQERWADVIGELPNVRFEYSDRDRGLIEIRLAVPAAGAPIEIAGVRFSFEEEAQ